MATRTHLVRQDTPVDPTVTPADADARQDVAPGHSGDRLSTAGAAYAAARAALDAALPAGWRRAAVESLPAERVTLTVDRTTAA